MVKNKNSKKEKQALDSALKQIQKNFGDGSIMRLGAKKPQSVDAIPTGSIALDIALGVGGIPRGRIVEVYGPESSGKTTLAQHMMAEAQKMGGTAALIDAEHAFDPLYAEKTGVDAEDLLVSQPDTGEQALEIAETLIRSNAVDIVVIDSVAALVPKAEIEGDIGDSHVALQARLMSQSLRRIAAAISKSKTVLVFTNQLRMKIGVMFGNPETTPGGRALKFYSSVRMDIRRIQSLKKSGSDASGIKCRVKVVKNKVAPPFRTAEFDILFNEGISYEGNLIDVGVEFDVVDRRGSWYDYEGEKLGQGKDASRQFLKENEKIANEIELKIKKAVKEKRDIPLEVGAEEEDEDKSEEKKKDEDKEDKKE